MNNKTKKINLIDLIQEINKNLFFSRNSLNRYNKEKINNKKISKSINNIQLNDPNDEESSMLLVPIKVSELKMHKILYFLYGDFYFEYKKELFDCNFESWRWGPVEKHYRKALKKNENSFPDFDIDISNDEYKYVCKIISYLLQFSTTALVDASHMTDPWKDNFSGEIHKWKTISKKDIQRYFKDTIF